MGVSRSAKTQLKASGAAPVFGCRAWLNYNGFTAAIIGSGNISSVTYNAVGYYTINFMYAMPDGSYAWTGSIKQPPTGNQTVIQESDLGKLASQLVLKALNNNVAYDGVISVAVFR